MRNKTKNKKTYDQLISGYYGVPKLFRNKNNSGFVISKSFDNGEVLVQKPKNNFLEYVVQSSVAINTPFEEYIVPKASIPNVSRQSSVDVGTLYSPTQTYTAAQEAQTDLTNPLQDDTAKLAILDRLNDPNATVTDNSFINTPPAADNQNTTNTNPYNKNTAVQSSLVTESESLDELGKAKSTEDDFVKDMQAILTGQKVFDPINKRTVDKAQLQATSQAQSETPPSLPQIENKHAIFDQIAQSMEYAKAYDLGSIDLEKRFNDFDKISEIEKKIPEKKSPAMNETLSIPKSELQEIGNEEFIKDLDIIAKAANTKKTESDSSAMSAPYCSDKQTPAAVAEPAATETGPVAETNKTAVAPQQEQVNNAQVTA